MAQLRNTTISDTGSLNLPAGTTAQRPASPVAGQIRYNTTISDTEYYDGSAWRPISDSNPLATGGTVVDTDIGGIPYRIHLFTNTGNTNFVVTKGGEVEYLIVAGGGGGGSNRQNGNQNAGGGGAGGLLQGIVNVTPQSYAITVGARGLGGVNSSSNDFNGEKGDDSSAFGLTAVGGGGGGSHDDRSTAALAKRNGGSGGGAARGFNTGGSGTAGQGNAGGSASGTSGNTGAGGGGAGSPGRNGTGVGNGPYSDGGQGLATSITGSIMFYAGGGGGSRSSNATFGSGGLGGGGQGSSADSQRGFDGVPNTGGGGGGGYRSNGGNGGSGIVIVRYRRNASTAIQPDETRPSSLPFFYNRDVRTITARTGLVLELDAANPIGHINDTWIDLSSRSRNPTVLGSLDFTGNSLRFPGDRINFVEHRDFYNNNTADSIFTGVPPQSVDNWSGDCTYIAWVNPEIIDGTLRHVFSDNNYNEGEIEFVNGGLRFSWGSGNGFTSGDIGLTPNRWYQVVQTHQRRDFDDVFRYEGFLNGDRLFSTTRLISTSASSYGPDIRLTIGPDFVGEMSLVQVYDRVLSDEEIRQNYIAFTTRYGG